MTDHTGKLENYRELLGLLGRMQLSVELIGKVDVSGVVQVTLMEAHHGGWEKLAEDDRAPWLRLVFANNLLDEIRKYRTRARDVELEQSIQAAVHQSASRLNRWMVSEQTSPSEKAVRAENGVRLASALACLPSAQRQAIELHHLQELPLEEIGKRMNRSKGAVAALIFRGTTRLRELLRTGEE
ncbi:RNA polymerase sigma factor [Symmachiella macrocystis]|uniref:RNA polymerase sigma factor n=1 Tax=Symmachiella macrocystis TaxID=2527985 RepID=A0A5C6B0Y8_9PLAN|nr:sigma-70 family RNA polymerase sigma factor [Symmachiella macrocystis]TWU05119.1 RNA polymerase sigma factor [Symmachiella macrocystis]